MPPTVPLEYSKDDGPLTISTCWILFKSTSFMWSSPIVETSLKVLPLFIILTLLPDKPRIMGWPTAEPKSDDWTPRRLSSDSPKLKVVSKTVSLPSTTWIGSSRSDRFVSMYDEVTIISSVVSEASTASSAYKTLLCIVRAHTSKSAIIKFFNLNSVIN